MTELLDIGEPAPPFTLPNQHGEPISLTDLRGSAVALVFYPFAFSRVCTTELDELQQHAKLFADQSVRLFGISVDSKYALRTYAQERGYSFDLLADFWPHGAVAKSYGVLDETHGYAHRATFILNDDGVIASRFDAPLGRQRAFEDYEASMCRLNDLAG